MIGQLRVAYMPTGSTSKIMGKIGNFSKMEWSSRFVHFSFRDFLGNVKYTKHFSIF